MRVLLQRVSAARVCVAGEEVGAIARGYLLLTAIGQGDGPERVLRMARKVVDLRLFPDEQGRFDRTLREVGGGALVVSQFTLYGDARKGRRPSFIQAAGPDEARELVDRFAAALAAEGVAPVACGRFGADMAVELTNDGPVTLWLDDRELFGP